MTTSSGRRAFFWEYVVAIVPVITFGLGACVPSVWRAARSGLRRFYVLGAAYGSVSLACLVVSANSGPDSTIGALGGGGLVLVAVTSTCQAFGWIIPMRGSRDPIESTAHDDPVGVGRAVLDRRREARKIAETDPELASVLKIGRPGTERSYFDGGLIDVNHADMSEIHATLDISGELAAEIVSVRESVGGFSSLNELGSLVAIAPKELERFRSITLFL